MTDTQVHDDEIPQSSLPSRKVVALVVVFPIALCIAGFVVVGLLS